MIFVGVTVITIIVCSVMLLSLLRIIVMVRMTMNDNFVFIIYYCMTPYAEKVGPPYKPSCTHFCINKRDKACILHLIICKLTC